jgi:hypothetical protein
MKKPLDRKPLERSLTSGEIKKLRFLLSKFASEIEKELVLEKDRERFGTDVNGNIWYPIKNH